MQVNDGRHVRVSVAHHLEIQVGPVQVRLVDAGGQGFGRSGHGTHCRGGPAAG
ncbi:hypothetical protein MSS93_10715 [Deinococcus radiodurans]|nr:hypothetical protein MSS93_10715 [Deinococcus radiodurans]